jgi:RNA polymerase sigma-70 factor, ECF subfamily
MTEADHELERQLITDARNGDLESFNQIVDRYQTPIYRLCARVLGDQSRAEDATQDTFIKAYGALDQYQGGSLKSWLMRIATNRCYDLIRAERRRPAASLDAQPVESEPEWSVEPVAETPDSFANRSHLSAYLENALGQLSGDQRIAVILFDIHGYSYEEIAGITDASLGTVKSRISRGRIRLRDILQGDERARELFDSVWRHSDDRAT